jgi:hypothetical protein
LGQCRVYEYTPRFKPRKALQKRLAKSSLDQRIAKPAIFCGESYSMSVGRTILALLIAISVAMLPAAGGAGVKSPAPADMAMMQDMPDCCPQKADPCAKAMDDCASMATCALKCFSFAGAASSIIVFPSAFASLAIPFAANPFASLPGSPPFRPPRI